MEMEMETKTKQEEVLDIEINAVIKNENIPIKTNIIGLTWLTNIFGNLEIPFLFRNHKNPDSPWLSGLEVHNSLKKINDFIEEDTGMPDSTEDNTKEQK